MIAFVRGRLAARGPDWVHVEVGGVGYLVAVPASSELPALGEPVHLHTVLQVREDALALFGFATVAELELFDLCRGVAGVGPKTALALLGTLPAARLHRALAEGDLAALTAVPGVGRKTAQRLVLELRDRLSGLEAVGSAAAEAAAGDRTGWPPDGDAGAVEEAVAALVSLGYSAGEARGVVAEAAGEGAAGTAELVRRALRRLGGAA